MIALAEGKIIARAELAGYPAAKLHHNATFSISREKRMKAVQRRSGLLFCSITNCAYLSF